MGIFSGVSDFFGLDIGTSAIRIVQLKGAGPMKSLVHYAQSPIETRMVLSDAKADQQKVMNVIVDLIDQMKLTTRNVAVGISSQRVFTTTADFDRLAPAELEKTIRYQADSLIPTPLAESKIDWSVLGQSPKDPKKVEVLLSSVPNTHIEQRLDALESIGLNVIAFEPETLALSRSIIPGAATTPYIVLDIGNRYSDLVIAIGNAPRLVRSIAVGSDAIVKSASQNLNVDEAQAEQFVFKFGMSADKLEGQVVHAIMPTIEMLTSEIDKSIKFFQSRYGAVKLDRLVVTGSAAVLPEFPLYLANKFGIGVEIGNAWRNIAFPPEKQNELLSVSNHFAVAAGLAERTE